ncbi:hypothetical protein [Chromobacterium haemolyticum]|uniref:hypothetical protein n=1 Tax=Chromobacterium haemolyticum TaxID=394935 RepID=UPI001B3BBD40|nr:hypothetical protein [Chromobacterium haemolyticum]
MQHATTQTHWAKIFMAGDIAIAKQTIRQFCMQKGLCVTVQPADYIYTGGEEAGFIVGLINYPRFPSTPEKIDSTAHALASDLMHVCCQHSYTIMTPQETNWFSRRDYGPGKA